MIGLHITDTNIGDYKKKYIEELKQMSFERELFNTSNNTGSSG